MFSRLYLIIGILSLTTFSWYQFRGVSPFDAFAASAGSPTASRPGSHTYHK